jgi:hypothetical protein
MSYIQVNPPKQYAVRDVRYTCNSCGESFSVLEPLGYELVKYVSSDYAEERWLPTYGETGYLHLIEQLLPDFTQDQEITVSISKRFEKAFSAIQKPSKTGMPFVVFVRARCSACGSTDLNTIKEALLDTPPLKWMEYQP